MKFNTQGTTFYSQSNQTVYYGVCIISIQMMLLSTAEVIITADLPIDVLCL